MDQIEPWRPPAKPRREEPRFCEWSPEDMIVLSTNLTQTWKKNLGMYVEQINNEGVVEVGAWRLGGEGEWT